MGRSSEGEEDMKKTHQENYDNHVEMEAAKARKRVIKERLMNLAKKAKTQ